MDTEDLTISYAEMRDRVGCARFGDMWRVVLTDDEQRELDAGFWESSSAEGYLVEEKAKAIEWRDEWVDGWLVENGLIDPVVRQHGVDLPAVSLDRFNAAFLPVFGSHSTSAPTEPTFGEKLEPGDAKERQHHEDPWTPPEGLTLQLLVRTFDYEPRPLLSGVIDVLAFGTALPDKVLQLLSQLLEDKDRDARLEICEAIEKEGRSIERIVAKRRRAAAALFDGARRADQSVLIGSLDRSNDQPIPSHYFDVPRNLGFEDNSIATYQTIVAHDARWQKQFDAEWREKPKPWVNVRVDFKWLIKWLTSRLTRPTGIPGVIEIPTTNGGFILQGTDTAAGPYPWPATPNNAPALSVVPDRIPAPVAAEAALPSKKRGPKSTVLPKVIKAMKADIAAGVLTVEELDQMLEKAMVEKYEASRDTCRKARVKVMATLSASKEP